MKRILIPLFAAILLVLPFKASADEGMWMLPLLQKMNAKALTEAGCRLSPDEIWSINHSSLKDAVVQFGGGCTAEVVSDEGLLLTNHHCGYSSIQQLSGIGHDYLADGYWAMKRSEELPCDGLTVTFLVMMKDVTAKLEKAADAESAANKIIENARKAYPGCDFTLQSFYNENVVYLIGTKTYRDIRFVGAPPSSIGKFGADTDNWMWPRHTCDFSMFRIYAGKDNEPADYSPENVPYNAPNHLKVSTKGINEGDFTMVMGFPGRTTRFQTSPELAFQIETNDIRIAARTVRQDIMMEEMLADPAVKIQYASKYHRSSNGWKKWQGMKASFGKLDIIGRAAEEEKEFAEWVAAKKKRTAKYGTVLDELRSAVEDGRKANLAMTLAQETLWQIELRGFAYADSREKALDYKDYYEPLDRREAKALIKFYRDNCEPEYLLKGLDEDFATMDIDGFVDRLFDESVYTSAEKLASVSREERKNDPARKFSSAVTKVIIAARDAAKEANLRLALARKVYTEACLEQNRKQPSYPDANFTMRFTYGHVLPYSTMDAVTYKHYTTLKGVMEKEDPNNWEFIVPERLKEIYRTKDYGDYAMENGEMPCCFITNNDITGGNSGSPLMSADGHLLGLAFDGNWDSMSSDVMFEPELQRCICVDIRYVLLIIDKFGGAGYLINEMDIVR